MYPALLPVGERRIVLSAKGVTSNPASTSLCPSVIWQNSSLVGLALLAHGPLIGKCRISAGSTTASWP